MDTKAYDKATRLLFTAVLLFSFTGIIEPLTNLFATLQSGANFIISWTPFSTGSSFESIGRFINLAVIAGMGLFAYGLVGWKKLLEEDAAKAAMYLIAGAGISCLDGICGLLGVDILQNLLDLTGTSITLGVVANIVFVIGYSKLRNADSMVEKARKGAGTLVNAYVVMLVGQGLFFAFPIIGRILYFFIAFVAFAMIIIGWKKISAPLTEAPANKTDLPKEG